MPDPRAVSAAAARRFFVLRHLLAPPRSLPAERASVMRVLDRLGSFQFDPLGVAGRNHDLILHARIDRYERAWTESLLYEERAIFEMFNKMLSLLPTAELPLHRIWLDGIRVRHEKGVLAANAEMVAAVLQAIRERGPLSSLDLERGERIDWYWGPTTQARAVLEALSEAGIVGIHRRVGNRRYFDLMENLYPAELLAQRPDPDAQARHRLLSRFRGHGLAALGTQAEMWHAIRPRGAEEGSHAASELRARLLPELVEGGELVPVSLPGFKRIRHMLAGELPLLEQAEREVAAEGGGDDLATWRVGRPNGFDPGVAFIAPLDSFAWDRDFLRGLFGFDYVWEVYVPEAKRRWGYYVLPLLYGDRLVGRIEPRIDTTTRTIRVLGLWWERGFDPRSVEGFVPAKRTALAAFRDFHGARRVEWASGLSGAARLFGAISTRGAA
jgi:hypothetical protein